MAIGMSWNGTNTVTVTGGTAQAPGTLYDMQVINDASGWSFMTEIIPSAMYVINSGLNIGNGTAATYIASSGEAIYFADGYNPQVDNNATFQLGGYDTSPTNPSWLRVKSTAATWVLTKDSKNTAVFYDYGSTIWHLGMGNAYDIKLWGGTSILWDSTIAGVYPVSTFNAGMQLGYSIQKISIKHNRSYGLYTILTNISNSKILRTGCSYNYNYGYLTTMEAQTSSLSVSGMKTTKYTGQKLLRNKYNGVSEVSFLNPNFHMTSTDLYIDNATTPEIHEKYTCDIHVADCYGANLNGVTVTVKDSSNTQVFTDTTASNGSIPTHNVSYAKWVGSVLALTVFFPHVITMSKNGYRTLTIENVIANRPLDLHFEMAEDKGHTIGSDIIKSMNRNR
jgi:hypothetical protein